MTHGNWVESDVGEAIAAGLRAQLAWLPDQDAQVLLLYPPLRFATDCGFWDP